MDGELLSEAVSLVHLFSFQVVLPLNIESFHSPQQVQSYPRLSKLWGTQIASNFKCLIQHCDNLGLPVSLSGKSERLTKLTVEFWRMTKNLSSHKSLRKAFQDI